MNAPKCLRILIVDDEEDMCWALQRIVESEGHDSRAVTSALSALAILGQETFHLAFVDVKLPDMEGLELVQRMRRLAPGMPCVLVSGYYYDDDVPVQDGQSSGLIAGFIAKPFLLSQVQQAMAAAAS